jgi:purine-binding chemotaxis protein CheW
MRPLPIESLAGAPDFVLGVAILRGEPVPVVDAARLLGAARGDTTRFVALRVGERCVALAVDAVLDVQVLDASALASLPPLLRDAGAEVIEALGRLDAELLVALRSACLVPEETWSQLAAPQAAAS